MSVIDSIQISGVTYTIQGSGGSGNPTVELTQAEYDALVTAGTVSADTYYIITDAQAGDLTNYYTKSETNTLLGGKADTATTYTKTEVDNAITAATSTKQDTLVSGTNIKTINNESLLGSGNIDIQGGGKAIEAGRGISITTGETADTVSFDLPISATTNGSILIGVSCSANRDKSFVGGQGSVGQGEGSFAFGQNCKAGQWSIAVGNGVEANVSSNSVAFGKFNKQNGGYFEPESATTLFSVGNGQGTSTSDRHNAFEIRQNGDIYLTLNGQDVKLQDQLGGGGSSYTAGRGISIANDTISFSLPISAGTGTGSIVANGNSTKATGSQSFAEGYSTSATSQGAHSEGMYSKATNTATHAEGHYTTASATYSHAEGNNTKATGYASHAEGNDTAAGGQYSHSEGLSTSATTVCSHTEGSRTIATNANEHASGTYNVSNKANNTWGDSGNTLFSVGNGTSAQARHNAFEIRQNGDVYLNDGTNDVKLQDYLQIKVVKLTQSAYDALSPDYDSNTLYVIVN